MSVENVIGVVAHGIGYAFGVTLTCFCRGFAYTLGVLAGLHAAGYGDLLRSVAVFLVSQLGTGGSDV